MTAAAVAVLLIAIIVLVRQFDRLPAIVALVASASPGWVAAAVAFSICSVVMLGEQQRTLHRALGTPMPPARGITIAYAQSSVATTVPGGSAVATAFTVRQLRAAGASTDAAVGTVALSGAASILGLAVLCLAGAVLAGAGGSPDLVQTATTVVALALTLAIPALLRSLPPILVRHLRRRAAAPRRRIRAPAFVVRRWRRMDRSRKLGRDTYGAMCRLRERDWYAAVGLAMLNWAFDACCLAAAARSVHVEVNPVVFGAAFLAIQIGRLLSPAPGGLGVTEPALVMLLCAGGTALVPATSAMLMYRALSYWLVAIIGLPLWIRLNRRVPPIAA